MDFYPKRAAGGGNEASMRVTLKDLSAFSLPPILPGFPVVLEGSGHQLTETGCSHAQDFAEDQGKSAEESLRY